MIIKADLDEMVFENREKTYGAYIIRKLYPKSVTQAFGISAVLFLLIVGFPVIKEMISGIELVEKKKSNTTYAELKEPPPIDQKEEVKPPEELPPPPPKRATIKFVIPEVVKDEEVKEEVKLINQDSLEKKDPGLKDQEGDPNAPVDFGEIDGTGEAPKEVETPKEEPDPDPTAFQSVEKEPAPANLDIIKSRITYPQAAKDIGVTGKVIVRVLVGPDGKYMRHMVLRSPHNLLATEVEKHLKSLEFTPGIQAGKPVKCWVTIPFSFNLN